MAEAASFVTLLVLLLPVPTGSWALAEKSPVEATTASSRATAESPVEATTASPQPGAEDVLVLPVLPVPRAMTEENPGLCPTAAPQAGEGVIDEGPFARGRLFLEVNSGAYFSQRGLGPKIPTFDFAPINLRLGVVLNDPCFPSFLRGSYEALAELSTAPVVSGFGDIVVGPTALLRYNWVQPNSRFVPYLQGGAGFAYNDAYEDRHQRAIGEAVEFTLKAAVGCHYFINDHFSVDAEGGFTHISNADLASRNLGINAVGGSMGITYYFPCGRP